MFHISDTWVDGQILVSPRIIRADDKTDPRDITPAIAVAPSILQCIIAVGAWRDYPISNVYFTEKTGTPAVRYYIMLLYHGTAQVHLPSIMKSGLSPRKTNDGNWATNLRSNQDLVYLTTDKIMSNHYALRAAIASNSEYCVILQIDTDKLDQSKLRVDENFLDIEERDAFDNCNFQMRTIQRTKAANDPRWRESLDVFGACSYKGIIPPLAISIYKKDIHKKDNLFYRPEIDQYTNVSANCHVYDALISTCGFNFEAKCWYEKTTGNPITEFQVNVEERIKFYSQFKN